MYGGPVTDDMWFLMFLEQVKRCRARLAQHLQQQEAAKVNAQLREDMLVELAQAQWAMDHFYEEAESNGQHTLQPVIELVKAAQPA
jgi:hypothetical protein